MIECDRKGLFRGVIIDAGIVKGKATSKSIGVNFRAQFDEFFNPEANDGEGAWEPWDYDMQAEGTSWIFGKDGSPSQSNIEALVKHAGWSGDLIDVVESRWRPTRCQFEVKEDEYKGEVRYRIEFINELERPPGGGAKRLDSASVKALQSQLGSQLRAIAGSAKPPSPAPGKPGAPPPAGPRSGSLVPPSGKRPSPNNQPVSAQGGGTDDIPFDGAPQA